MVERARKLRSVEDSKSLDWFAKERAEASEGTSANNTSNWKALTSLFRADSWDELVTLLGFSEDITDKVSEAVERLKVTVMLFPTTRKSPLPVITFAEPEQTPVAETIEIKPTPSEQSAGTTKPADGESITAPSLFDDNIGKAHTQEADFFGTIGALCGAIPDHVQISRRSFVTLFRCGYI